MSGQSILVADDDPDIRDLVALKLTGAGYLVHTAVDGTEALATLISTHVDLALIDVMMPGLSGIDVVREARARDRLAAVPLVLLTAKAQESDVERGFAVGATDYVTKPFSPRVLLARVRAILDR